MIPYMIKIKILYYLNTIFFIIQKKLYIFNITSIKLLFIYLFLNYNNVPKYGL